MISYVVVGMCSQGIKIVALSKVIHSSVIMESSLDREWIQRTVYHLQWLRQGWRPLTDLPLQWLQWWGLLRGSKDHKSVFIFPCYSVMGLCSYTACHKWSQEAQRPVQLWEMGSTRSQEQCSFYSQTTLTACPISMISFAMNESDWSWQHSGMGTAWM